MDNLARLVDKLKTIYYLMSMIDEDEGDTMKCLITEKEATENDIEKEVAKLKIAARNG